MGPSRARSKLPLSPAKSMHNCLLAQLVGGQVYARGDTWPQQNPGKIGRAAVAVASTSTWEAQAFHIGKPAFDTPNSLAVSRLAVGMLFAG